MPPGTGPQHPEFWKRFGRCISAKGGGGDAVAKAHATEDVSPQKKTRKPQRVAPVKEAVISPASQSKQAKPVGLNATTLTGLPSRLPEANDKPVAVAEFGRRVALVIGNGRYEHVPTLSNAINDAKSLAQTLEATGFQSVTLSMDLKRDEILTALAEFAKVADTADWAAVYYAGHGIEAGGANYMIPVDAKLKVDRDIDLEAVDVGKVLSAIGGAKKLKLVILDACRDNPFLEQMKRTVATRSITRGLARMEPEPGVLIVYSAKHGEVALDGKGQNSPFATALINRIHTPNLEIRRLFDLVRDDVLLATGRRQQPFSYGSVSGSEDFYFEIQQKAGTANVIESKSP